MVVLVLTASRIHFDLVGLDLVSVPKTQEVHLSKSLDVLESEFFLLPPDRLREHKDGSPVPACRMSMV